MTVRNIEGGFNRYRVTCDYPDCDTEVRVSGKTPNKARGQAERRYFSRDGDKDFCGAHSYMVLARDEAEFDCPHCGHTIKVST